MRMRVFLLQTAVILIVILAVVFDVLVTKLMNGG